MTSKLALSLSVLALLAGGCGGDDDDDDGTTFDVELTTAAEVPVCVAAAAGAEGEATVTINEDRSEISVELSWSGLSDSATNAHIHAAAAGTAGGVIFPLGMPPSNPVTETFTAADYPATPPDGAPADFAAFVTAMEAGGTYLNVHTAACPPGEIRGQIN